MSGRIRAIAARFLLFALFATNLFAFQNCSEGFKTQELASTAIDPTLFSVPEINFAANTLSVYNTAGTTIDFEVKLAGNAKIKSISCQLNNEAPADCNLKSVSYVNLVDGDYTLKVVVMTQANVQAEATRVFRRDRTLPVISVSMTPALITGATAASFAFSATDNLSGVEKIECSLNNAAFAVCTSPAAYVVAAGAHNFQARAFDKAGNVSQVYSYNWTVDVTAPVLTIASNPNAFSNLSNANFVFSSNKVSTYECQLDNGGFAACTSPRAYQNLAAGNHSFAVRATDAAGNVSQPANFNWMIDVVAPVAPTLTSNAPAITQLRTASLSYSSTDVGSGVASFQCSLDNAAFATCVSPSALANLSDANHIFKVRSIDNAGNVSAESQLAWRVDTVLPTAQFTTTPLASTSSTSATFAFNVSDSGSGLASTQCSLDNVQFANCVSPTNLTNLAVGNHSFRVQARDQANNMTLITFNWTITAPVAAPVISTLAATPATINAGESSVLSWAATGATTLRLDNVDVTGTTMRAVNPTVTTTYTLVATNATGSVSRTITINVNAASWVVPTISLKAGSAETFTLASTLPATAIKNGTFSVDPTGAALPAGMTLSPAGVLSVGTAAVGDTTGVIFSYNEP